jgi:hypothetical protein
MLLLPMFQFIGDLLSRITLPGFLMFVEFGFLIFLATVLMLRFWKITAGIGILMFGLVCWQEPRVLLYSALLVLTVWLIPKISTPLATFIFDRKKSA